MKVLVCAFLALMVCACLVQVQAGLSDMLKGGHDDKEAHGNRPSKYQGGIAHQVAHTIVDGGVDRLVDMGEQKFSNPLMDAALVGIGHKLKGKVHDKINSIRRENSETDREVNGDKKANEASRFGGLFRKRRAVTETVQNAAVAAGKHVLNGALGLAGQKNEEADNKSTGSTFSNIMESAKSLVGLSSSAKDEPKKADKKEEEEEEVEESKEEESKEQESKEAKPKKGVEKKKEEEEAGEE